MCIQIIVGNLYGLRFFLLLIFLFPITVLLIVMHECPFGSEFPLCVYTERIYFLCVSLYCVPRSQWRKLLH